MHIINSKYPKISKMLTYLLHSLYEGLKMKYSSDILKQDYPGLLREFLSLTRTRGGLLDHLSASMPLAEYE
jgi:hypothetical protein